MRFLLFLLFSLPAFGFTGGQRLIATQGAPAVPAWTPISWDHIVALNGSAATSSGNGELLKTVSSGDWDISAYTNTHFSTFPVMLRFKVANEPNNTIFDCGFADNASNNLNGSSSTIFNEFFAAGNFLASSLIERWQGGSHATAGIGNFASSVYVYVQVDASGNLFIVSGGNTYSAGASASGKTLIPFCVLHSVPTNTEITEAAYCTLGASCP